MKTKTVTFLILFLFLLPCIAFPQSKSAEVIIIDGVINPVVAEFTTKAIRRAASEGAECLIIQMDTPGGLDLSMRSIIKEMLNADIPVIVYVSPGGARAASAGAIITLAADIAAMAPGTNIGAAHPVSLGGGKMGEEMAAKVENDAAAYVESIAIKKNRNKEWAIKAVRESVSITEIEALKINVIDLIASDLNDLLSQIDGREIKTASGVKKLTTKNIAVNYSEMGLREKILDTLSNPNIAYILMMIGMLGLYFELSNPGAIFPGAIGVISLILAFFAFQTLPVNYAGILLILLALILFILEIKVTSFGMLSVGGIISLTLGSLMLFDSSVPFLRVSYDFIIPVVAVTSAFFIVAISLAVKAQRRKPTTGKEGLLGSTGIVKSKIDPQGKVFIHGEYWDATSNEMIPENTQVEVIEVKDTGIKVKKA
ncbi:MAG: nodulation protein NfeD [Deltaproteobacteria bacterium]|jgi:membrane-bound serine protease (ClpP class)|nr:nodulation protein NfeD [Deltaproteobacteria bacterium]